MELVVSLSNEWLSPSSQGRIAITPGIHHVPVQNSQLHIHASGGSRANPQCRVLGPATSRVCNLSGRKVRRNAEIKSSTAV